MGIDVDIAKCVTHNDTHQNRVNTSVEVNPNHQKFGGLLVQGIYRRVHHRENGSDGNPFMYALKDLHGYSITKKALGAFRPSFSAILDKAMANKAGVVVFIPMPSSKPIPLILALLAKKRVQNSQVLLNFFIKQTAGDVAADLGLINFKKSLKQEGTQLIADLNKNPAATFTMKLVKSSGLRRLIIPLKVNPAVALPANTTEVILVDDLISSGATLQAAHRLLACGPARFGGAIEGLSLLGSLK